jgi:hypothetical protein
MRQESLWESSRHGVQMRSERRVSRQVEQHGLDTELCVRTSWNGYGGSGSRHSGGRRRAVAVRTIEDRCGEESDVHFALGRWWVEDRSAC